MEDAVDLSDDEKSPSEYREDLFNTLCGDSNVKPPMVYSAATTTILPPKAQCPVCSKWFRDKTRVHEHLNVHYGARPLYCNVCGTTFAARSNLIKHAQQHQAPFTCYVCGHGPYSDVRLLTEHTRRNHEELHRFSCHLCDLSYQRQADLSDHLVTHPPALMEVRRRKRGAPDPDSPVDLSSADADESVSKRPHSGYPLDLQPDHDQEPPANIDFMVAKADAEAFASPAFFGIDPSAMKHASVEELASQISKLTNLAANLQQNGMLSAFANGGSFMSLPAAAFASNHAHASAQAPATLPSTPRVKHETNGGNAKSESIDSTGTPQPNSNSKLPSILLRKPAASAVSSPLSSSFSNHHERERERERERTVGQDSLLRMNRDGRPQTQSRNSESLSSTASSSVHASRKCEIGTQCTLLDEQTALLALPNVPPCQRELLVFQQLLAKLISRGDVFRCQHCEIVFFERGVYYLHRSLHDEHNPFQCAICGKRCSNRDNFTLHFVNQKHQTGGCTGACITLPPMDPHELGHTNGNGK